MRRILVVGSPGAGKSTLATKLAAISGLPLIHLDAHYWQAGWRKPPREAREEQVAELLRGDTWIMDGNYRGTFATRLAAADTVVLITLPVSNACFALFRVAYATGDARAPICIRNAQNSCRTGPSCGGYGPIRMLTYHTFSPCCAPTKAPRRLLS